MFPMGKPTHWTNKPYKRIKVSIFEGDDEISFSMPLEFEDLEERKGILKDIMDDLVAYYAH